VARSIHYHAAQSVREVNMNTNAPYITPQFFLRLATIVVSLVLSGYAEAGDRPVQVSEAVSTIGLNLNTPEGARELYMRLKAASRRVCRDPRAIVEAASSRCADDALGRAVGSANRPQLTLIYLRYHSIQVAENHGIRIPFMVADR